MAALHWRPKCFGFWILAGFGSKMVFSTKCHKYFHLKWVKIELSDGQVLIETAISELNIAKTQTFWSPVYMYLGKLHVS